MTAERRQYYRIDDQVSLGYRVLQGDFDTETQPDIQGGELKLRLENIDRQLNQAVNIIWNQNPAMARAMGLLNRKLTLIATSLPECDFGDSTQYTDLMVNISGCGIAFGCNEALAPGTRLRLSMVLHPSHINLHIDGTVIVCEPASEEAPQPYWIRVDFDADTNARELLIQHVVQKHSAVLSPAAESAER